MAEHPRAENAKTNRGGVMEDSLRNQLAQTIDEALRGPIWAVHPTPTSGEIAAEAVLRRFDVRLREPQAEETL